MNETSQFNNKFKKFLTMPSIIALSWTAFQLYMVVFNTFPAQIQRPIHVGFGMALVFALKPMFKGGKKCKWYDILFIILTFATVLYLPVNYERLVSRIPLVDPLTTLDIIVGVVFIALLFEASRRATSVALAIIALVFLAYAFFGANLPGLLGHQPIGLKQFIETQFFSTEAIFSSPISVSVSMVFYFLIFGAFLEATPAGGLFVDLANVATRKSYGGTGKGAIVASGLFGMISGSAAANTVSVGTFFYPMMKKSGFKENFSAAILAIGGTGGQLIPPIMGAAAFIMVDMIGVPYSKIMKTAIIPSIVYILALYFVVHYEAVKSDIKPPEIDVDAAKKRIRQRLHLLGSIVVLVALIISGRSLMLSAFWATIALIALCFLRKETRIDLYSVVSALESAANTAIVVAMPCAMAGVIIGVIVGTGLGLRLSSLIAAISQGSLLISLIMTMLISILLGMGMPTSAAYIMCAVLLAPAIVKLGVEPIVAHFFIFYFANLSMITPPVAVASYAAAGLGGLDMWKVGIEAFVYSIVVFLLPFAFVFNPALLGIGSFGEIIWVTITIIMGTWGVCMAIVGHAFTPLNKWQRILLTIGAVLLIVPEGITDIIGMVVLGAVLFPGYMASRKAKKGI